MKNLTYLQYYNLIIKIKGDPYLYVSTYREARENLGKEQFCRLQQQITDVI